MMDFREQIGRAAAAAGKEYNILPSFIAGVAWLETGGGKSTLCKTANNIFSIKGEYNGKSVTLPTTEYYNGKKTTVNAKFRKYPSYVESLEDFCKLIKNGVSWNRSVYSKAVIGKDNIVDVVTAFGHTPYMTDPAYSTKLLSVIKSYHLTDFDGEEVAAPAAPAATTRRSYTGHSIVDYLKFRGIDSSFANRARLAKAHGISHYEGSAKQNSDLLNRMEKERG